MNSIPDGYLFICLSIAPAFTLLSALVKVAKRFKKGKVVDVKLKGNTRDPWWAFAPLLGFAVSELANFAESG